MAIFSAEALLHLLTQYNPWWKTGRVNEQYTPPQRRQACRETGRILKRRAKRRFVVLSGARRVGKTTIMFQLIADLLRQGIPARNIVYLSFDNPIVKLSGIERVLRVYDDAYPTVGECYFFFDEIQYAPDWENWIKVLYDTRPQLRLVATGSASPALEQGAADSGAGRWQLLKIPTMSFYEYCDLLQLEARPELPEQLRPTLLHTLPTGDLTELMARMSRLTSHFHRYLLVGGFPELALDSDDAESARMLREDVVDKVIKRDILTLFNVRNPLLLEKLFLYLCLNSSQVTSVTTISKELEGVNKETLAKYIQFLQESNLIYLSEPVGLEGKAILKGNPKIYIADAAIRNAVLMLEDVLTKPEEMGVMVETAVYKHLLSFYAGATAQVGYYRRKQGKAKEIDVVADLPAGRILCEVKYRENSHLAATDAIVELSNDARSNVIAALVITKQAEDYGLTRHPSRIPIMRLPAAAFLYLLGQAESEGNAGRL